MTEVEELIVDVVEDCGNIRPQLSPYDKGQDRPEQDGSFRTSKVQRC
jgi:hypothetical protein